MRRRKPVTSYAGPLGQVGPGVRQVFCSPPATHPHSSKASAAGLVLHIQALLGPLRQHLLRHRPGCRDKLCYVLTRDSIGYVRSIRAAHTASTVYAPASLTATVAIVADVAVVGTAGLARGVGPMAGAARMASPLTLAKQPTSCEVQPYAPITPQQRIF